MINLCVLTLIFALLLKYLPQTSVAWGDVWLGAAITAALWSALQFAIAFYIAFSSYKNYGAIGAIMALRRAGLDVPGDVSVIGFDDTLAAMTHSPGLTTIRQPLKRMGEIAAEHVLRRIAEGPETKWPHEVTVEPELVVRESTAAALAVASTVRARASR